MRYNEVIERAQIVEWDIADYQQSRDNGDKIKACDVSK